VLPGRLGLRFALEALFLVLLAIGAGLADLRPGFIVLVMAVAWLLVAIVEFTAERISASPLTYLLPQRAEPPVDEPEADWPMPEERTVVAPPEPREPEPEPEPEPDQEPDPEPEPMAEPEPVPVPDPESERPFTAVELEPEPAPGRLRSLLRRREPASEPEPAAPPRHVKLLPRRSAPEESRAEQEVAELFDKPDESEQSG
jgi:outer membrane biosynthesis protein TonB